jgi:hypothetical protein
VAGNRTPAPSRRYRRAWSQRRIKVNAIVKGSRPLYL